MSIPGNGEQPPYYPDPRSVPPHPSGGQVQSYGVQPGAQPPVPYQQGYPQPAAYQQHAAAVAVLGQRSAGLAALLSILLVGAGQMYCGRVGRGFAFLGASILSYLLMFVLIGFLLAPAVFIWALVDAINLASRHNAELLHRITYGQPYR